MRPHPIILFTFEFFSCSGNILRGHDQFVNIRRSSYELIQYQEKDSLQEIINELETFTRKLPENLDDHNIFVKPASCEVTEQQSESCSNCALTEKIVVNEDAFKTFKRSIFKILGMMNFPQKDQNNPQLSFIGCMIVGFFPIIR